MRYPNNPRRLAQVTACGALWLALLNSPFAEAASAESSTDERVEWHKVPVDVALKVGIERQITFPSPVKVGVPASLKSRIRAQSVSDTVYLQATRAFDPTRLVVQTRDGGHTYLLDVEASDTDLPTPPIQIVDRESQAKEAAPSDSPQEVASSRTDPVILTRFAAQQLYAPARLLKPASGIVRVLVPTGEFPLVRGGEVAARALIGWRSGGRYVTAVKLTNTSKAPIVLDPRALRGEWLTAAFQHNRLLPAGSEADTTVAYLVSARPFAASR